MPLLIVVTIGAVVLWLLLSVYFEKVGNMVLRLYDNFKNKLISNEEDNGDE